MKQLQGPVLSTRTSDPNDTDLPVAGAIANVQLLNLALFIVPFPTNPHLKPSIVVLSS